MPRCNPHSIPKSVIINARSPKSLTLIRKSPHMYFKCIYMNLKYIFIWFTCPEWIMVVELNLFLQTYSALSEIFDLRESVTLDDWWFNSLLKLVEENTIPKFRQWNLKKSLVSLSHNRDTHGTYKKERVSWVCGNICSWNMF